MFLLLFQTILIETTSKFLQRMKGVFTENEILTFGFSDKTIWISSAPNFTYKYKWFCYCKYLKIAV